MEVKSNRRSRFAISFFLRYLEIEFGSPRLTYCRVEKANRGLLPSRTEATCKVVSVWAWPFALAWLKSRDIVLNCAARHRLGKILT